MELILVYFYFTMNVFGDHELISCIKNKNKWETNESEDNMTDFYAFPRKILNIVLTLWVNYFD